MGPHGLSFHWDIKTNEGSGVISVRCVISHQAGHEEVGEWQHEKPDTSGGKNAIQAKGSAQSYLKRYTLTAVAGVEATGIDDDGAATSEPEKITDDQCITIEAFISDNEMDKDSIKKWVKTVTGSDDLHSIKADQFNNVMNILKKKLVASAEREPG